MEAVHETKDAVIERLAEEVSVLKDTLRRYALVSESNGTKPLVDYIETLETEARYLRNELREWQYGRRIPETTEEDEECEADAGS